MVQKDIEQCGLSPNSNNVQMQLDLEWTFPISPSPIVQIFSIGPCPIPSLVLDVEVRSG